jgi:cytochrome c oxidase assembly protein subunit 15
LRFFIAGSSEKTMIEQSHPGIFVPAGKPATLARWLLAVAALIMAIVVVGGITRLTESGVSITEWKVVSGTLPPLNAAQWQAEFDAYRQTPQFIQINGPAGMTLADYKFIFFWEWAHRLLARSFGLALALPLAWFWLRREIPAGYKSRLLALLALGGLQGAIGWWMVKSGIQYDTKVSHFRLAAHLMVALVTMAGLVWTALDLKALADGRERSRLTGFSLLALAVLAIQLIYGALMAGLRAGHLANDYPTMQGHLVPQGIDWTLGVIHSLFNDPFLVHFIHRWCAVAVVVILTMMGRRLRKAGQRSASIALHATFGTQFLLGIATVISGVAIWLAVLHQLTGALLVAATVWGAHALGRRT